MSSHGTDAADMFATIETLFLSADSNGNGLLEREELMTVLHKLYRKGESPASAQFRSIEARLHSCCLFISGAGGISRGVRMVQIEVS